MFDYNIINNIFSNNMFFVFYENYLIDFCNLFNSYLFIFIYLNKYNFLYNFFYNFFYNFLLIILIFYPFYNYIQLLINIKILFNKYYNLLPPLIKKKIEPIVDQLYDNIYYIFLFYYEKRKYIRLYIRLTEIYKEKERYKNRRKYVSLQFIDFFFIKIILDHFFALLFRLLYFLILFFFKLFFFIIKKIFLRFSFHFKLFILLQYLRYKIKLYILFLNSNYLMKIFTFIRYIKLEFFLGMTGENNVFSNFILNAYQGIAHYFTKWNNPNVWEYWGWSKEYPEYLIYNYKYSSFLKKYNFFKNYIYYFFFYFNIIFKIILLKFFSIFYYFFYYFRKIYIFFSSTIWFSLIRFIKFTKKFNKLYIYIGYSWFFFYDMFINILFCIFKCFLNFVINMKWIILIYIFYKLGIIHILCLYISFLLNSFQFDFYRILFYLLETFYDCFDILNFENLYDYKWNEFLINYWHLNYNISVHNRLLYYNETVFSKIINFISFDYSDLVKAYEKKSLILKDQYTLKRRFITFSKKFYNLLAKETSLFYLIFKEYFLFKYFSIYHMYIYIFSNINIYYYLFKKTLALIHLLYIYIYCHFKFVYFYFLPNHDRFESIIIIIYYFFCKFWWLFFFIRFIFFFFYFNFLELYTYIYINICIYIYFIVSYFSLLFIYLNRYLLFFYLNIIDLSNNFYINIYLWSYKNYELYLFCILNKIYLVLKLKEFLINYLRLDINNLLNFRFNDFIILGNRTKGGIAFDLDAIDFAKIYKYKISLTEEMKRLGPILIKAPVYRPYEDNFVFYNKFYTLNNLYYIYNSYYEKLIISNNLFDINFYILNFFVKNLIFYNNYSFIYIILYFFICPRYIYIYNSRKYRDNINIYTMWFRFKKNFNYKLLKKDTLFVKAFDLYREKTGKKKILNMFYKISNIFPNLSKYNRKIYKKIIYKYIISKINKIEVGDLSNHIFNKKLNNYIIERNMYYNNNNNSFYWKNFVFFGKNIDYYYNNSEKNFNDSLLNFFLALTFRKSVYSPRIFGYFSNFTNFFFRIKWYSKVIVGFNDFIINYFTNINNLLYFKKITWLINNDPDLLIYRTESSGLDYLVEPSYTLSVNTVFPKFKIEFFWLGFFFYLFMFKLHFLYLSNKNIYHARIALAYFYMMLMNNNFLYLYDIYHFWFNSFVMFDSRHLGYVSYDYRIPVERLRKFFPKPKVSTLFIIHNDPLFLYNKNYAYHLHHCNVHYIDIYSTFNIILKNIFTNFINLIILFFTIIYNKYIIIKFIPYKFKDLLNIFVNYKKNIIKLKNYILLKKKILS